MKQLPIFLFIVLLLAGNISVAQNSVLAGKIVDENDKPVSGAEIKVRADGVIVGDMKSDNDGLYYSQLLPCGRFVIDVNLNGKDMGSRTVKLSSESGSKKFFLIRVAAKKISISEVDSDPSISVKLSKIAEEQKDLDFPPGNVGLFWLSKDSARSTRSSGQKSPQMK